jgi:DNA-binding NtrC family response regulator
MIAQNRKQSIILLVEDDVLIAEMARDAFADAGFDVIAVSAAEDALGLAFMDVDFDLLFTDINLAGPLTGWELLESMREMRPALPMICASGSASREEIAKRANDTHFVSKPYRVEDIIGMVHRLIEEAALTRTNAPSVQPFHAAPRLIA